MRHTLLVLLLSVLLYGTPLRLVGNTHLASRELYDVLGLHLPYTLEVWRDHPTMETALVSQSITALESYYRAKGYFQAKVTMTSTDKEILFTIAEGEPIIVSDIAINSPLDIELDILLHPNDLFTQEKFATSKTKIKKRFHDAGYCNSTFNTKAWVDLQEHKAHLVFEATPHQRCTFGTILVQSTPNLEGTLVTSLLHIKEGEPYSPTMIQKSYEALYAQEAVGKVSLNDTQREGSVVPLIVTVEEGEKPIRFTLGLGVSSDQGFGGQLGLKHRNLLGNFRTLSLEGKFTQIKQKASGLFSTPLNHHFLGYGEVGYSDEIMSGYRSKSVFEKITLKHLDTPQSVLLSLLFDEATTYDSTNTAVFPNSHLFIPSPMAEINIDTRDHILEPTQGNWINVKGQGSLRSSISDATYFKTLLMGAHLQSWGEYTLATRAQWGVLRTYDNQVPSAYRFYAGGMNSNRAYQYRQLGPKDINGNPIGFNSLVEGSVEFRFPLSDALRGVLFTDLTYGSDNYLPDYTLPYWGVGVGIRYRTPVGPIAVDLGVDPNDPRQYVLNFRIGELF
ncbi:MAG: BamA/TamA family outer membrane protein [Sulfuricurvum sp.]